MFRRILISAACASVLAGCMSSGYSYRADRGDYYYGQPRVEYREYGYGGYDGSPGYPGYYGPYRGRYPVYGYGGYGGYGRSGFGASIGYGYPGTYGRYGSGWGGYPYYTTRPRHIHHHHDPRPPAGYQPPPGGNVSSDGSPWRNLDELRRRQSGPSPRRVEPAYPQMEPRASRDDGDGSNARRMIRESREMPQRDPVGVSEVEP